MSEPTRLIIENRSSLSMTEALSLCQSVVIEGRISESRNGDMYCAATIFTLDDAKVAVWSDRNKASDRLVVCDQPEQTS